MLRYYQMALKELEKSNDKHEAKSEVKEPQNEQVVNGQTLTNNRKRKKSDEQESSHTHVTKRGGELKKKKKRKKSKEDLTVIKAVARHDNVDVNEVRKRDKKKEKKKKEKRLEMDSDAGNSNDRQISSSRFSESRIDPQIVPKEIRRKRKKEGRTELSEVMFKKGKHSAKISKSQEGSDKETHNDIEESNFSCNGRKENIHTSNFMESSNLIQTTNTSRFEIFPRSSTQSSTHVSKKSSRSGKESTKESQKLKKRKNRTRDLESTKTSSKDNRLNGNNDGTEVIRERVVPMLKMDEAKFREAVKISNEIHETYTLSKERLQALAKKGIRVKKGKWSNLEYDLLKFNMARFLEHHDLSDPYPLLFHSSMDATERRTWKRFARDNEFFKELGKGIQRELFSIYKCATRIYDKTNYVGKYTEDEIKELKRLHSIHGANWVTIGQLMDRSRMSVNRKLSKLPPEGCEAIRLGKWTDGEFKRLYDAVHFVTNTAEGESVFHGVNWKAVAQMVKTRTADMCREKWLNKLCWSMSENKTESKWSKSHELKLITRLYNSGVTEECDVDWMDVKSEYDIDYSPQWLRLKWAIVKKNVPNYQRLSFEEVVDYLYRVYGQTLRDNLQPGTSNS